MASIDHLLLDPTFLDQLYRDYQRDQSSVDPQFAQLFQELDREDRVGGQSFAQHPAGIPDNLPKESLAPGIQIYSLVQTYREFGHLIADIDPLGLGQREHPFLELSQFGLSDADLDTQVSCEGFRGLASGTVREHIEVLQETYCGPVGVEYMDAVDKPQRDWLQAAMEPSRNRPVYATARRQKIAKNLVMADTFEQSLHKMYTGAKRFSLEGATTLITLLQTLIVEGASSGIEQMVLGMAHRGRLNVLANVMQKPLTHMLAEFEGRPIASEFQGYGDVKYHMGYSADYVSQSGKTVHLSMAFNPSHLETVNPVVAGIVRAKQDLSDDAARTQVVPILMHGDAAFAGQGVVAETLMLAGLEGYSTGGTLHVIVNNQVGFTANPEESRSTRYASDLALSARAPVFHVNADHPEVVAFVAQLALRYRQKFASDIVIDLVCYRRHGHNELDDASFTQPMMAKRIAALSPVSDLYAGRLVLDNHVSPEEVVAMKEEAKGAMLRAREEARKMEALEGQRLGGVWKGLKSAGADWTADTTVDRSTLEQVGRTFTHVPDGWTWHQRLLGMMRRRTTSALQDQPLDWGTGEALAFGSLLLEGTNIRLSGQDSGRGTFGHRHSVYRDQENGARYVPLNHLGGCPDGKAQGRFDVINSPLSEEAVLGFEYGYSCADPWSLVIWEAQFGDFVNGAQVIIDQLVASAEYKWGRMTGIVMLLPHGYEGQGPEHSSARLERFLELCAERNMQVCNLSTPAQYFHALRRQMHRDFRKPLVIMSPKSLLRHAGATSSVEELASGTFHTAIDDQDVTDKSKIRRILMCSGKIFYALREARIAEERDDIGIIRIEQLYPFPLKTLKPMLAQYRNTEQVSWVQEEPRNMGAWRNLHHHFKVIAPGGIYVDYIGRDSRAVPATGVPAVHKREEAAIIRAALDDSLEGNVVRRVDTPRTNTEKGQ
ncbi:MAG: 2-oxoglutarate dehydrogenase E1 component [Myxococcales bacterium]|nr:2-oxoglutarate dehydrogenase E1 component [Myxococcales bacterium]